MAESTLPTRAQALAAKAARKAAKAAKKASEKNGEDGEDTPARKRRKTDDNIGVDSTEDGDAVEPPGTLHVKANPLMADLESKVRSEVLEMLECLDKVKVWIQLNVPKVLEGHNVGVSIQEESIGELSRAEDNGFAVLDAIAKYHLARARMVNEFLKSPDVDDFRASIMELDFKEWVNLRTILVDLRNNWFVLYDSLMKNLDRIKKPRSAHSMPDMY